MVLRVGKGRVETVLFKVRAREWLETSSAKGHCQQGGRRHRDEGTKQTLRRRMLANWPLREGDEEALDAKCGSGVRNGCVSAMIAQATARGWRPLRRSSGIICTRI